jgi:riboflavin biosynthesis pyrimidine reductase
MRWAGDRTMTKLATTNTQVRDENPAGLGKPIEALVEADDPAPADLPQPLQFWYGGPLGFREPRLVANFVASIDGVVSIPALTQSNKLISGDSEADRVVMGLLRAFADVVLVGSGTFHGSPHTVWTPEHAYPPGGSAFARLRQRRGRPPIPQLAVMTASGRIDVDHPALNHGALVLTTELGAKALHGRLPRSCEVAVLPGTSAVNPRDAIRVLTERGHRVIMSEAGPRVFGSLLSAGLVDELFLTRSPVLAGRTSDSPRLGRVEGIALLPDFRYRARLASLRRHGEHLLLRYTLDHSAADDTAGRVCRELPA